MAKTAFIRRVLADHGAAEPRSRSASTIGILGGGPARPDARDRPPGRSATGSRSSTRTRTVRPRRSPTARSWPPTTTRRRPSSWPTAARSSPTSWSTCRPRSSTRSTSGCRSGPASFALRTTQHRLAERRFLESIDAPTAPWREVRTPAELEAGARALGYPLRLKAAIGGYDGRSQVRIAEAGRAGGDRGGLGDARADRRAGRPAARAGARLRRSSCRSSSAATWPVGRSPFPPSANRHDAGILVESVAPAPPPVDGAVADEATELAVADRDGARRRRHAGRRAVPPARRLDRRQRARAAGPQQRPLDDRGRRDQPVRAAHPGDLRPAARVRRTPTARPRWSTCSGTGPAREATSSASRRALADPLAHLHVYDKREVFERRKMGHLTVAGADGRRGARSGPGPPGELRLSWDQPTPRRRPTALESPAAHASAGPDIPRDYCRT